MMNVRKAGEIDMARSSHSVLVVDDDADIRSCLADILEYEGYQVKTAVNGRDALGILREWHPNAIMLDLMMPILDGWAFLDRQRADPQLADIPVIVMSASHTLDSESQQRAVEMVQKPFELDTILSKLAEVASRCQSAGGVDKRTA
jgi:CheY-like chemotaxis protein